MATPITMTIPNASTIPQSPILKPNYSAIAAGAPTRPPRSSSPAVVDDEMPALEPVNLAVEEFPSLQQKQETQEKQAEASSSAPINRRAEMLALEAQLLAIRREVEADEKKQAEEAARAHREQRIQLEAALAAAKVEVDAKRPPYKKNTERLAKFEAFITKLTVQKQQLSDASEASLAELRSRYGIACEERDDEATDDERRSELGPICFDLQKQLKANKADKVTAIEKFDADLKKQQDMKSALAGTVKKQQDELQAAELVLEEAQAAYTAFTKPVVAKVPTAPAAPAATAATKKDEPAAAATQSSMDDQPWEKVPVSERKPSNMGRRPYVPFVAKKERKPTFEELQAKAAKDKAAYKASLPRLTTAALMTPNRPMDGSVVVQPTVQRIRCEFQQFQPAAYFGGPDYAYEAPIRLFTDCETYNPDARPMMLTLAQMESVPEAKESFEGCEEFIINTCISSFANRDDPTCTNFSYMNQKVAELGEEFRKQTEVKVFGLIIGKRFSCMGSDIVSDKDFHKKLQRAFAAKVRNARISIYYTLKKGFFVNVKGLKPQGAAPQGAAEVYQRPMPTVQPAALTVANRYGPLDQTLSWRK